MVRRARLFGLVVVSLLFAGFPAVAQRRGGVAVRPPSFRSFPPRPLVGSPLNPNFAPLRGVPGLGFDYQHLAVVNQGLSQNRLANRRARPGFGFITPILGFGPFFPFDAGYSYYGSEEYAPQYEPPVAIVPPVLMQLPAPANQAQDRSEPPATVQAPAPVPELGQLILVRRDGQVLFVTAFTTSKGQLTYVTRDGTRRSFPVAELDKAATRDMNDANGTSVALPED